MKRSGFRKKTYEEVKEQMVKAKKRAPRASELTSKPLKPKKRVLLPKLGKLQKQADSFLTPIAKKIHPKCEACGADTQVGHHWIEKSRSAFLRYAIHNIISLCHSCHAKLHNRFGNSVVGGLDVAEIIISKRGRKWKELLDIDQPKYQRVDRAFYTDSLQRLKEIYENY